MVSLNCDSSGKIFKADNNITNTVDRQQKKALSSYLTEAGVLNIQVRSLENGKSQITRLLSSSKVE